MTTPLRNIIRLQRAKMRSVRNLDVTHQLKTWPRYFEPLYDGRKKFDLRKREEGREFIQGEYVLFREWHPETQDYTGRWVLAQICYVFYSKECIQFGFEAGLGGDILGFRVISNSY